MVTKEHAKSAFGAIHEAKSVLATEGLTVSYGATKAVRHVTLGIPENRVTAIIGPSGCGKSTFIRALNRMNDFIPSAKTEGLVNYRGVDIYSSGVDPAEVRRRIGMVFQRPNPFPKSILANVTWGPKINGFRGDLRDLAEEALRKAALWEEVKDRLASSAFDLSGGQQQRLCIARALAMSPEVILMDEPCSALDPAATARIEDLLFELKERYTIVIVTHNMQQAARVADFTAFLDRGQLVEYGETDQIFTRPREKRTEDYVTGRFG